MWNFIRKNVLAVLSFLALSGAACCLIVNDVLYEDFNIRSALFWVGFSLLCFAPLCYALHWYLKKRREVFQARERFGELQKEATKYVFVSFYSFKKIKPKKRAFDLTLYGETDEALLVELYRTLADDDRVENAYICDFKATLPELLSVRGKCVVLDRDTADVMKSNPLFADLFNKNRIITFDYE